MLNDKRKQLDAIDEQIMYLLEKRFSIVKGLEKFKKNITDKAREKEILNKTNSEDIKKIYKEIFKISKKIQKNNF